MGTLRSVWVDEACIFCSCCETAAPDVFRVDGGIAMIVGTARVDGTTDSNPTQSPLNSLALDHREAIHEAAAGCPVEAIHVVET